MKKIFVHIDIETGSTVPRAVVPAIAMVAHDENYETLTELDLRLVHKQQYERVVDQDTFMWWTILGQEIFENVWNGTIGTKESLRILYTVIEQLRAQCPNIEFVANPPTFDQIILEDLMRDFDITCPWNHWEWNCLRTLRKHYGIDKDDIKFEGVKHNPLHDCRHQVKIFQACNGAK